MNFDAMAAAIDWLDAYRAGDIDAILKMYAKEAVIDCGCGCGGMKSIAGEAGIRAYWVQRLKDYPASDLDDLKPSEDGATISYVGPNGVVSAILEFNADGMISHLRCGPSK